MLVIIVLSSIILLYIFPPNIDLQPQNSSDKNETSSDLSYEIQNLHLQNLIGEKVSDVKLGDTIMVAGTVTNLGDVDKYFEFIVEVKDENSTLIHSGLIGTSIPSGESKNLTVGWLVSVGGTFAASAYIKENFESQVIISNSPTLTFEIEE